MDGQTRIDAQQADLARDLQDIEGLDIVSSLLQVVCQTTGMGFAAIARVTDDSWTALAVQDNIAFGLKPGGQLDVHTTLCKEVRTSGTPVVINHASEDTQYRHHHTPRLYAIESYISVPIVMSDGAYFGNLCAIDPRPAHISEPRFVALFELFARLIALQLENHRRRAQAEAAMLDERAAGELREQFIAILGHDLRNPVAAISATAHLLKRKSNDPEVGALAQRILNNVKRVTGLIDDVLDFARGRLGGGFGVQMRSEASLGDALAQAVRELVDAHPQRTITSAIQVGEPVRCDVTRLQQLVSNLLGNALAHGSADGPVGMTATVTNGELVITVSNDGEPIPRDSLPRVFAPFWRRSTSGTREGLGLGLFICAEVVKAHQGSLDVSSSLGGTRFVARMPTNGGAG